MSDRARRAASYGRAGADPLLDELAAQSGELAKRWAIALLERAEPEQLAAVDVATIAREGPGVIEAVLTGAEAGAVAAFAGVAGSVRAFEALRGVLWDATVEAVPRARSDPRAARTLLELCDTVTAACAEMLAGEIDSSPSAPPPSPREAAPAAPPAGRVPAIVIVDEHDGAEPVEHAHAAEPGGVAAGEPPAIAAHDARARQGPAAWISSIGSQLESFERDRRPFAVLLIELVEPAPAGLADERRPALERVLAERLRDWRGLSATRERPGRHWLVAPATDRGGAEVLRERLQDALGAGRSSAAVAIGIAVCPDDASDAAGLAAQADLDIYSSRPRSVYAPGWQGGSA